MIQSEIQNHYCKYCRQVISSEQSNTELCQKCIQILVSPESKEYIFPYLNQVSDDDCIAICHAIDFVSMRVANARQERPYYGLADIVYRRTKKDVFEYKQKTAREALENFDVVKFAVKHYSEIVNQIFNWYYHQISNIREFDKYIYDCLNLNLS